MKKNLPYPVLFFVMVGFCFFSLQATALACKVGEKTSVEWKGKQYEATVKSLKGGKFCIHYDGWADSWDECVDSSRIACAGQVAGFKKGDKVEVLWKGTYYKSTIKEAGDGKYFIGYDGWTSEWDEWVTTDRIRK